MTTEAMHLTQDQIAQFERDGYLIVPGLLANEEAVALREHFMELHAAGPVEPLFRPIALEACDGDVLRHYPRFMHPHRVDELSMRAMLDDRFRIILRDLFGEEALAA